MKQDRTLFQAIGPCAQRHVFIFLIIVVFLKSVLFNWICFSGIQENYLSSLIMSLPQKLVPALFVAGFVCVTKSQRWTIVVNILIDIWIIANLLYFKANGIFLSWEIMTMVDNMDGFWDSLLSLIGWDIVLFPLITITYAVIVWNAEAKIRSYWKCVVIVCMALLLNIGDQIVHKMLHHKNEANSSIQLRYCMPFSHAISYAKEDWIDYNWWSKQYMYKFSIVGYLPACVIYKCAAPAQNIKLIESFDDSKVTPFLSNLNKRPIPQANIIFVLVESLESWAMDTIKGVNFMPNLNAIIQNEHTLFCRNLKSQTVHGNSADGQLITVTGLLPITDGVVCKSFATNAYPSYAQCYPNSSIINPYPGAWNQSQMTKSYHFQKLIEPLIGRWSDSALSDEIILYADTAMQPFCTLGITVTSHMPFGYGSRNPKYIIQGMPAQMNAYLNCLAYTDSCIGAVFKHIGESECLSANTMLVITGDHTVFRSKEKEMDKYAKSVHIDFQSANTCTPLIIWSSLIEKRIEISDTCYQMDIYPTIMHMVGCETYYWKGLGADLCDPRTPKNRPVSEEEAYRLSNLLIKSNYFKKFETYYR